MNAREIFGETQCEDLLEMLRERGPEGVSREELIFDRRMTQCATRVFELRKLGFVIRSEDRGGRYPTWYVLESEPLKLHNGESAPTENLSESDYMRREREEQAQAMPLFAEVRR